jgi:predicted FMN-binding regulatory protein PaiB
MAQPWSLEELDETYFQRRMTSMVAFDIPVERIETKARLGQKQSAEMNSELADWLEIQPDPMRHELARLLRASL